MQTFTLSLDGWPRRLAARNALVRGTDRIEALLCAVGVSFAFFLALRRWLDRRRHADWDRELRDLTASGNRTNRNTYRDET
jgi:hypothetical protein